LVAHYCPVSRTPNYFNYIPESRRLKWKAGNGKYVSSLYYEESVFNNNLEKPSAKEASAIISSKEIVDAIQQIRNSEFFDADFYLAENHDVRDSSMDPALHYLVYGFSEKRDPGPNFSTKEYFDSNPSLSVSCVNPLLDLMRKRNTV
jgi:hypothetical protein